MQLEAKFPVLKVETVEEVLQKHNVKSGTTKQKRTRNTDSIEFENITVNDIYLGRAKSRKRKPDQTLFADVSETLQTRRKTNEKLHSLEVKFDGASKTMTHAVCTKCDGAKVPCSVLTRVMYWLQRTNKEEAAPDEQENVKPEENVPKKNKALKECRVVIEKLRYDSSPERAPVALVLGKLKKEPAVESTPQPPPPPLLELKDAEKFSMVQLIREYQGTDKEEFLRFCTARMTPECCSAVEQLTVEQADTDLWHELRKGRITASRMHEASRCTMANGSLVDKIMGIRSGFSFAMKRGTELEGQVFAKLQREYPGLRNAGLVLDPEFPWMGASPDGLCEEFVLEIKCPYTRKTFDCYVDVSKLSKKYFAQIQLQMHMTHRTKALLAVAALDFESTKNITKVWIEYDKSYVDAIMAESYEFWCAAVFKALLKKRNSKK